MPSLEELSHRQRKVSTLLLHQRYFDSVEPLCGSLNMEMVWIAVSSGRLSNGRRQRPRTRRTSAVWGSQHMCSRCANTGVPCRPTPADLTVEQPATLPPQEFADRGKSRGSTRGSGRQTSDVGLSGAVAAVLPRNFDQYIERCDGEIERTQELVGAVIVK